MMTVTTEILQIASYLGDGIGVGIASLSAGIGEGYTAGHTAHSFMRQPKAGDSLVNSMLVSQAVTETGAIFALVIALLLIFGGYISLTNEDHAIFDMDQKNSIIERLIMTKKPA